MQRISDPYDELCIYVACAKFAYFEELTGINVTLEGDYVLQMILLKRLLIYMILNTKLCFIAC